jgi:hypothetical protein
MVRGLHDILGSIDMDQNISENKNPMDIALESMERKYIKQPQEQPTISAQDSAVSKNPMDIALESMERKHAAIPVSAKKEQKDEKKAAETWAGYSPAAVQTIAGLGSAAEAATLGVSPWAVSAGEKALGKLGVERFAEEAVKPISEIKQRISKSQEAANVLYPTTSLIGTGAGIVGGALALPAVGAAGLGARGAMLAGAGTGALYGGISGAAEKGSVLDAVKGAAIGAGIGAVATPALAKLANGLEGLIGRGSAAIVNGKLTPEAINVAKSAGMSSADIAAIEPHLAQKFLQRGMTPAAVREAQAAEFGITPTRGMVTKSPEQLAIEAKYAAPSYERIGQEAATAAEQAVGGAQPSLRDAIGQAIAKGTTEASKLKSSYESAYKIAEETPGRFDLPSLQNVGTKLFDGWAKDPKAFSFRSSQLAQEAAKDINKQLGQFYSAVGETATLDTSFRSVVNTNRLLNDYYSTAKTATDRAAITKLKADFNRYVKGLIDDGAFYGDVNAAKNWKSANDLFGEYQKRFGMSKKGEEAGSLFSSIIQGNKNEDDVARMLFNFSGSGDASMKATAMKTYNQLRRALGSGSPEIDTIKRSFMQQLMTPSQSGPSGFTQTSKQINTFLQGNAAGLAKRLFTDTDRQLLSRYSKVMENAGAKSNEQLIEEVGRLRSLMRLATPIVVSGVTSHLGLVHPTIASVLAGVMYGRQLQKRVSELPAVLAKKANAPITSEMTIPAWATTTPVLTEEAGRRPRIDVPVPMRADGGRIERRAGGRVTHEDKADQLIAAADRAKRQINRKTEPLLQTPDEAVAKALAVANQAIGD